ncbi:MAG TPA: beta-ketoacyl-[acyl-carrier-protein] synthase family protein [Candidatus Coprenecus pullistercoris]|nr:beta-ketoacyl-[acyl-carrier-protein] synthase family protein [Candidatus Coprenecus pullistercoris]
MDGAVYITGMGVVCAIGTDCGQVLHSLRSEASGIGPVRYLRTVHRDMPVGEVGMSDEELYGALGLELREPVLPRTALLGMLALREALRDASLEAGMLGGCAFISGTTVGGMDRSEQYYRNYLADDSRDGYIAFHDCRSCTELTAAYAGRFGTVTTVSTACSSAANAIIMGARMIESGETDIVVAGGSECLSKFHFNGFRSLMILDRMPCRPFDACRAGLNLGEGAGYVVLESRSSALRRGARPLAVLSGYGNSCDAYHQTATSPSGEGPYLAMSRALGKAGLSPDAVDYVNAHGTATENNDATEAAAIRRLFGDRLPYVSSTKAFTGHTTSASAGVEAVISILALRHGFVPANLRWSAPMEDGIVPVTSTLYRPLSHVLCNSFGFGGNDSALLLSKYAEDE